jgi:NADPH:quinone reductase-like Zn-dependent oxidoreductase
MDFIVYILVVCLRYENTKRKKNQQLSMASPSSLFSVVGKNVLITGGSRGIGEMIAKGLTDAGANVLLTSRSEDACRKTAQSIPGSQYVASNVSSREGCEELAKHVAKVFDNRLDVLVNNAGTSWGEPLERKSGRANWGFDKVSVFCVRVREGERERERERAEL